MLIDETHKRWAYATALLSGVAIAAYVPYSLFAVHGAKGGTIPGLIYGILGMALLLFAGLLSLRRKLPAWRIGRVQTWMRGHLWLGLFSFVLVLCHGGFRFGGTLTTVLMVLFILVLGSGVLGLLLQQYLPRALTTEVPMETIFDQIAHIRGLLLKEADELVASVTATAAPPPPKAPATPAPKPVGAAVAASAEISEQVVKYVRDSYYKGVRSFLVNPGWGHRLASDVGAQAYFQKVRLFAPPSVHPVIDDLENICEEERQLLRQIRLHHWMYGWLLVHVPLSSALIVLAIVHAFIAMRY